MYNVFIKYLLIMQLATLNIVFLFLTIKYPFNVFSLENKVASIPFILSLHFN